MNARQVPFVSSLIQFIMLPIIAWRNVWRSRVRSLVVIVAVALGLWAGIFLAAFSWGMNEERAQDMIETQISHLQVHTPAFKEEGRSKYTIPRAQSLIEAYRTHPRVNGITGRAVISGMVSSSQGAQGVQIQGVYPEEEAVVTQLDEKLIEGEYFEGIRRNPILIGGKLAEKLKLEVRKKVVLNFQDAEGNITAAAFRIAGIYRSINSKYDESNVFVRAEDLQPLLGLEGGVHEVALLLNARDATDTLKAELQAAYPELSVEGWKDMAPDLKLMAESFDTYMQIFMVIIMLGMAFGIINTMLMAVLERTRELGMLMSIGMNKLRLFAMITLETVFLSLIGCPLGMLFAWGTVSYFGMQGIDMSMFAEGLASYGMRTVVHPYIEWSFYVDVAVMIFITAVVSALYPAWKALRLKPAEAVRSL